MKLYTKILPAIAMFLIFFDALGKAIGYVPQALYSDNAIWIWYITALGWFLALIVFIKEK